MEKNNKNRSDESRSASPTPSTEGNWSQCRKLFSWIRGNIGIKSLTSVAFLTLILAWRPILRKRLYDQFTLLKLPQPKIASVVSFGDALRRISEGQIRQLWYLANGHIQMESVDGNIIESYLVPGSEVTLFDLAKSHIPSFQIREPRWSATVFQTILPFLILIFSGAAFKSMVNRGEEGFWRRKNFTRAYFWKSLFFYGSSPFSEQQRPASIIKFEDVISPVKHEVYEIVDFIKRPEKYLARGASLPRGILLVGPPDDLFTEMNVNETATGQ